MDLFKTYVEDIIENSDINDNDDIFRISKKIVENATINQLFYLQNAVSKKFLFFHNICDTFENYGYSIRHPHKN